MGKVKEKSGGNGSRGAKGVNNSKKPLIVSNAVVDLK